MPTDYSKGKIYAIRCTENDNVYIGSTVQPLSARMAGHRGDFKRHRAGKFDSVSSFEILKYESAYIELIEECPCDNVEQLRKREGEVIRATENCVNKIVAGRTDSEYYNDNKAVLNAKHKEYRDSHKAEIAARGKLYRDNHKEKIIARHKRYNSEHVEERKKHYLQHREELCEKAKAYRETHKTALQAWRREIVECSCGSAISRGTKARHLRSAKHLSALASLE